MTKYHTSRNGLPSRSGYRLASRMEDLGRVISSLVLMPAGTEDSGPSRLCQNANFGARKPIRHSRESGNPGVLEGSLRGVSPLHPSWIPAFAGMTISGAVASLGWGFDTTLVSCPVNSHGKMRRIFRCRQGAMTSRGDLRSPQGVHHARKSNAADGEKDQQITMRIDRTGH